MTPCCSNPATGSESSRAVPSLPGVASLWLSTRDARHARLCRKVGWRSILKDLRATCGEVDAWLAATHCSAIREAELIDIDAESGGAPYCGGGARMYRGHDGSRQLLRPSPGGYVVKKYWLIVERLENWNADKASGFTHFGIGERHTKTASRISEGDLLISYISSGVSKFADIREAIKPGVHKLRRDVGYDGAFSQCIFTRSVLALEKHRWLPMSEVVTVLDLTKASADWRQLFRISLRQINEHDGETLVRRLTALAQR